MSGAASEPGLSLYEFTLWGRDLVFVVGIKESPYYRVFLRKYMRIKRCVTLSSVNCRPLASEVAF